jgi:hypothetical protein
MSSQSDDKVREEGCAIICPRTNQQHRSEHFGSIPSESLSSKNRCSDVAKQHSTRTVQPLEDLLGTCEMDAK